MLCELWLSKRYVTSGRGERIISITAFISTLGIALGVLVLIVVIAVMSGFDRYLQDKLVGTNAHLVMEFYEAQAEPDPIIDQLKESPHFVAAAPFVAGQAFIKLGPHLIGVEMRGFDHKRQAGVTKIAEYLQRGSFAIKEDEVVIGEELALRLGLDIADTISFISPATLTTHTFRISGIFKSGMYQFDTGLVMTSIPAAQEFFKMPGEVSGIGISVDSVYQVEAIKNSLYAELLDVGPYEIRTWMDTNRNFLNALRLEKTVMFIVVTMTTVVAAFGIVSTLIMSVMNRIKDIGILKSVGAKTRSILEIFIFQGLRIGITGILFGVIGGISLALSLNKVVEVISRLIGRDLIPKDIYYFDRIPTALSVMDISTIVLCALTISLLASLYPAYYAAGINPSEAVRHE